MKTYFTHSNGGRPFKVVNDSSSQKITVYKVILNSPGDENDYICPPVLEAEYTTIFIGKSNKNKQTKFNGGYGKEFNGNSILIKKKNTDTDTDTSTASTNKYIFIGDTIYSFTALDEIVKFKSPVGNSDVPYPCAMDRSGNFYLLIENVIITSFDKNNNKEEDKKRRCNLSNVYQYYYSNTKLKKTFIVLPSSKKPLLHELSQELYCTYNLSYNSDPEKDYNRLVKHVYNYYPNEKNEIENKMYLLDGYKWSPVGIRNENSDLKHVSFVELDKLQYVELLETFGYEKGFYSLLNKTVIVTNPYEN